MSFHDRNLMFQLLSKICWSQDQTLEHKGTDETWNIKGRRLPSETDEDHSRKNQTTQGINSEEKQIYLNNIIHSFCSAIRVFQDAFIIKLSNKT